MKHIILACFVIGLGFTRNTSAQVVIPHPIPCVDVTPESIGTLPSGVQATDCVESEGETVIFNSDQNYSIKAGEFIRFDANTVIEPDSDHQFHAYIQNNGMDLAWYAPYSTPGTVGLYDKLEIGVQFNDSIDQKIERFIAREDGEKLNPFNPDEVDLYAEFWVEFDGSWFGPKRVNGFYYNEFERSPDLTHHDTVNTPHNFRIRFAPTVMSSWRCQVKAVVDEYDTLNAYEFTFDCVPSSKKGYVAIGTNKRYFTRGGEPFFPVGHNIFGPSHDSSSRSMSSIPEYFDYYARMRELKANGANYFRHIVCPWNTEIEFEHLGDYSNRMTNAWEMDNMIDTAEVLDLIMHFNMAIHYTFEEPIGLHHQRYWDWSKVGDSLTSPPGGCFDLDDSGYCYRRELEMEHARDFFDSDTALVYYKRRIRYMMSRWGYSTNISIMEILSEANHAGHQNVMDWTPGVSCKAVDSLTFKPYQHDTLVFPEKMYDWHTAIASYMRDDLNINHLISCNYTGVPAEKHGDDTYKLHNIDVATYNEYRVRIDKYQENYITSEQKLHNPSGDFYIDKPFMHSEYGMGDAKIYECDRNSTFIKRAVLTPFTGLAAVGITWDDQRNERGTWQYLKNVTDFMEGIPLDADNYQAQPPIVTSDKAVEVLYLRNFDPDGFRAVGVVSNRTYNFYTQRLNDSCSCAKFEDDPEFSAVYGGDIYLSPQNFIGADYEDEMILPNMGWVKHYNIQWHNAITGDLIFTEGRWSNSSEELKIEFPLLTGDSLQPLVYFQVYPWEDESFKTPIENDSMGFAFDYVSPNKEVDESIDAVEYTNWENVQKDISISPNPTNDFINVSINNVDLIGTNWLLKDGTGKTVLSGQINSTNFQLNLSVYENGVYYLTFEKVNYVNKVVKN